MLKRIPDYYNKFGCLADRCPDTCCAKWEIPVDSVTAEKYLFTKSGLQTDFKKYLKKDRNGDYVFIQKNKRCPFLTDNNLCRIIIESDEKNLCYICETHPRFFEEYGEFTEISLSLSCPEANRLILSKTALCTYTEYSDSEEAEYIIEDKLLPFLVTMRKTAFDIISDENLSVNSVFVNLLNLSEKMQFNIDNDRYIPFEYRAVKREKEIVFNTEILSEIEILTDEWKEILNGSGQNRQPFNIMQVRNLLSYFVYRYFLKAINSGDILSEIKFILFAVDSVLKLSNEKYPFEKTAMIFSKEVEHNEENLDFLHRFIQIN